MWGLAVCLLIENSEKNQNFAGKLKEIGKKVRIFPQNPAWEQPLAA